MVSCTGPIVPHCSTHGCQQVVNEPTQCVCHRLWPMQKRSPEDRATSVRRPPAGGAGPRTDDPLSWCALHGRWRRAREGAHDVMMCVEEPRSCVVIKASIQQDLQTKTLRAEANRSLPAQPAVNQAARAEINRKQRCAPDSRCSCVRPQSWAGRRGCILSLRRPAITHESAEIVRTKIIRKFIGNRGLSHHSRKVRCSNA